MQPQPTAPGHWETDLDAFFATLDYENEAFARNIERQGQFYAATALPALDAAAGALRRHGHPCETGLDQSRIYLIVRRPEGPVEFQYAVLAEARIEGVTPYVHCWFEENKLAEKPAEDPEKPAEGDDQGEEGGEEGEGGEEKKDDKKDDKEPARTKTIELLCTWAEGRQIEGVTREEILTDFLNHYKEAVGQLRSHLHTAPR